MEIADSDLLFIDVDASTPAVKQEQEEFVEPAPCAKRVRPAQSRFKCSTCHYVTYHRSLFQEHINRHEGIKPYKCELCPYSSVSKKYAKKHQEKHKTCACGYISRNALQLKRHVAKCGGIAPDVAKSFPCPSCNRDYVDEKALAKHSAQMEPCALCATSLCAGSVRTHMSRVHARMERSTKTYKFQCSLCAWRSSRHQRILLHLIHHPQQVTDNIDVNILRKCNILPPE